MPGCARKQIVIEGLPGIYHCWSRCVRRAFLLGEDEYTGKNYNHRRQWVIDRLKRLTSSFVVDVCFLAVMSNHLHLVLRVNPRLVKRMGTEELARRWLQVYPGRRDLDGKWTEPTRKQIEALSRDKKKIKVIRKRLASVSWFMSALSEYIARRSNKEEKVSGRFWAGRFSCREIVDQSALLICGMYVDLNQIRAGEARTPEGSKHCSVWYRIQSMRERDNRILTRNRSDNWLAPLALTNDDIGDVPARHGNRASDKGLLPMRVEDYLKLLDWAGRQVKSEKKGAIPKDCAPILERLSIVDSEILAGVGAFPELFPRMAGTEEQLRERAEQIGQSWMHGVGPAKRMFGAKEEDAQT